MEEIKKGKYRHFKGGEYEVLHLAKDSETLETLVVYKGLAVQDRVESGF